MIGVGLGVVLLAVGVVHSPLLDVDRVEVVGAAQSGRVLVVQTSGVRPGARMVGVPLGTVAKRIRTLPWVARVTVRRSWPGTVRIAVTERVPVAAVPATGGGFVLLDAAGWEAGVSLVAPPRIARLDVDPIPPHLNTQAPARLDGLVEVAASVPSEAWDRVASLRAVAPPAPVTTPGDDHRPGRILPRIDDHGRGPGCDVDHHRRPDLHRPHDRGGDADGSGPRRRGRRRPAPAGWRLGHRPPRPARSTGQEVVGAVDRPRSSRSARGLHHRRAGACLARHHPRMRTGGRVTTGSEMDVGTALRMARRRPGGTPMGARRPARSLDPFGPLPYRPTRSLHHLDIEAAHPDARPRAGHEVEAGSNPHRFARPLARFRRVAPDVT